ncbi:hypothetical protein MTO96_019906 [Rhipicephalus appendiculatus]
MGSSARLSFTGINPVSSVVSGPAAVWARERGGLPPLWAAVAAAVPCLPTRGSGGPRCGRFSHGRRRPGPSRNRHGSLSPLWSLLANEAPLSLVGRTDRPPGAGAFFIRGGLCRFSSALLLLLIHPVTPGSFSFLPRERDAAVSAPLCLGSAASPPPPRHESAVVPQLTDAHRVERREKPEIPGTVCAPPRRVSGTHAAAAPVASRLLLAQRAPSEKQKSLRCRPQRFDDPSSSSPLCCGVSALSPAFANVNAARLSEHSL